MSAKRVVERSVAKATNKSRKETKGTPTERKGGRTVGMQVRHAVVERQGTGAVRKSGISAGRPGSK